jgi:cytochrome bd-type quinol oxidase subunit 2
MPLFFLFGMKIMFFSFLVGFDLGNGIFKAKQK